MRKLIKIFLFVFNFSLLISGFSNPSRGEDSKKFDKEEKVYASASWIDVREFISQLGLAMDFTPMGSDERIRGRFSALAPIGDPIETIYENFELLMRMAGYSMIRKGDKTVHISVSPDAFPPLFPVTAYLSRTDDVGTKFVKLKNGNVYILESFRSAQEETLTTDVFKRVFFTEGVFVDPTKFTKLDLTHQFRRSIIVKLHEDYKSRNIEPIIDFSQTNLLKQLFSLSPNLRILNLCENEMTELPAEIGNLSRLEQLYLCDNKLTSLPESIGRLSRLIWLDVSYNSLKSLPNSVGQLSNLQVLKLDGDKQRISKKEIRRIKKLLPQTTISSGE